MQTPHPGLGNRLGGTRPLGLALRTRTGRLRSTLLRRSLSPDDIDSPETADVADLVDVAVESAHPQDRFQLTGLRPVARRSALLELSSRNIGMGRQASRLRGVVRPLGLFDWALLAIEATGALVVGWLVFQYIYTAYFDTAPRRVSPPLGSTQVRPSGGAAVARTTATHIATATPTPTRFAETLPPLVGAGAVLGRPWPDDSGAIGARPTATPTIVLPTATATIEPKLLLPVRLRIPVMVLDSPVQEVEVNMGQWEVSALDVGHHEGTGNPGEQGNVVLAAHRDINSALFRELDRLTPGDAVYVSNSLREYRYIVQESIVVGPNHTEVMAPTTDKRVTLITCTPIGLATQRLIVVGLLDEQYSGTGRP